MASAPHIEVTEPRKRFPPNDNVDGVRPDHHLNDTKTMFGNPWPSFRFQSLRQWASFFVGRSPSIPKDIKSLISNQIPTWGAQRGNEGSAKATWLGHACYFVHCQRSPAPVSGFDNRRSREP